MKLQDIKRSSWEENIEHGYHNDKPDYFLYGICLFLIGLGLVALIALHG